MSVKGKEILVIDDVADVRLRCRKTLESFGMVVFEAASTTEALEILGRLKKAPDLILLDLQMKGKSGFDFLSDRKASVSLSGIPVIVSSGLSDKTSVAKAIGLGANDYVLKPVNATVLLQRVRKHLRGSNFRDVALSADRQLPVTLELKGVVTRVEKTSFTLESAARIAKGTRIELPEAAMKELKLSGVILVSHSEPGALTMTGGYQTQIDVIGLSEPVRSEKAQK